MFNRLFLLLLFFYSTLSLACQDNQVKIVKSSSKRYQVGACLGSQTRLYLGLNERLVLQAFKNGETFGSPKSVTGTYDDEDSIRKGLGSFIQMLLGLVPKRAEGKDSPIWEIDVDRDEHFCLTASTKTLTFWRAEADETIRFTLTQEKEYEWNWPLKEHRLSWPAEIPIQTGQEYLLKINDRPKTLILDLVPPDLSKTQQIMWMSKQKCLRQAKLLSEETW